MLMLCYSFVEDKGQKHWYDFVLNRNVVQSFLDGVLNTAQSKGSPQIPDTFTLTVSVPRESGSLYGWRVNKLTTPGR
jgi:hypothetical protein